MEELNRWIAEKCMEWPSVHNWRPTTDIRHTFEVIEKMISSGWKFECYNTHNNWAHDNWGAGFWKEPGQRFGGFGETPALAICKAAKTALETVK